MSLAFRSLRDPDQRWRDLYAVPSGSFAKTAESVRTVKRGDRLEHVTIAYTDAHRVSIVVDFREAEAGGARTNSTVALARALAGIG